MDQNEYVTYKNEIDKWLDNANRIITKCNNIRNLDEINNQLNEINVSTFLFYLTYFYITLNIIITVIKNCRFYQIAYQKVKKLLT